MILRRNMLVGSAAVLLAAATRAAGAPAEPQALIDSLVGTVWQAVTIAGVAVKPIVGEDSFGQPLTRTVTPTLTFPSATQVAGHGGCNVYSGSLAIVGDRIRIGSLATTLMLCWPTAVMDQEQRFLAALKAARRFSRDGAYLVLHPSRQGPTTRLAPLEQPSRRG